LIGLGVKPDDRIALCLERSPAMLIGLLGILKAGAAYVPLDPAYPCERLTQILSDAAPQILLCDASGRSALGEAALSGMTVLPLDAPTSEWTQQPDTTPDPQALRLTSHHLAYVIYTSGSTGTPKGTAMPHSSVVNLIEWHRKTFGSSDGKRVLQFAALSFDVAFQETFSTLCTGETLVLLEEWMRKDAGALIDILGQHSIERLFVPPQMLQIAAEYCDAAEQVPGCLKDMVVAGEQLRISAEIRELLSQL